MSINSKILDMAKVPNAPGNNSKVCGPFPTFK